MTKELDDNVAKLKQDIEELRRDFANLGGIARDAASEQGRNAAERARRAQDRARQQAHDAGDRLEQQVEAHPLTSILTAFGIGFLVSMLLDRRR
ncbi:MAG: DUF883 C-terminal domain-containing protein [Gammaproteobacteria bacterium]